MSLDLRTGPARAVAYRACNTCRHCRKRPEVQLFDPYSLQSPGVLKAQIEWEQQEQERRRLEQQRFDAGAPFAYEPQYYAWCAAATPHDFAIDQAVAEAATAPDVERDERGARAREIAKRSLDAAGELFRKAKEGEPDAIEQLARGGRAVMNPVTGEVSQIYTLCNRLNSSSLCPLHEPRR